MGHLNWVKLDQLHILLRCGAVFQYSRTSARSSLGQIRGTGSQAAATPSVIDHGAAKKTDEEPKSVVMNQLTLQPSSLSDSVFYHVSTLEAQINQLEQLGLVQN